MRLLVAYGSKMGGTKGLAEMLGTDLENLGFAVDVRPAREVTDVEGYDAIVVGGALYYWFTWHKDAKNFVKRHRKTLQHRPVWFFSSGPLDDSATKKEIPPIRRVRGLMHDVEAREHITFGGRMEKKRGGLPVGDWRDPEQVQHWAEHIAAELSPAA